jgi:methionyl aminopeptidase
VAVNVIMLGPPGAGKGTQAERVALARRIPRISTGEILREAVHNGTMMGRNVKAVMDRGELVGDDVMIGIVTERLGRPDAAEGFVLDGFPRTVAQAAALDTLMTGRDPLIVLDIVVPESELARRLGMRMICEDCGVTADGHETAPGPCSRCVTSPPRRRPPPPPRRRQQCRRARTVQDLPARHQTARRFLSRAADVPVNQRRANGRWCGRRSGCGHRGVERRAGDRRQRRQHAVIVCRSAAELERMREAGRLVGEAPGVSTAELDELAEKRIKQSGATPAFKGYHGYPATICASINDEVIHGIPSGRRVLAEGDVISIDVGASLDGYFGDSAVTLPVGRVSEQAATLLRVTEESLYLAIERARPGNRVSDIGHAVQRHVEAFGFSVVREFVGHGIGVRMHEEPQVPNYGEPGHGPRLAEGMVLAIEPMVNAGKPAVKVLADGWTAVTRDTSLSAHFEHTVAVTAGEPWILTAREVPVSARR